MSIQPAAHASPESSTSALLAEAFDIVPVPLWVIDGDGSVVRANPAAARFLGYRDELQLIGGPSHALLHRHRLDGTGYPAHECPIVRADGPAASEEWFITRAGQPRRVRWSTQPMRSRRHVLLTFDTASGASAPPTAPPRSIRAVIHAHFTDPSFDALELAVRTRMPLRTLQALCARRGFTPAAEIRRVRLEHARGLLEAGSAVRAAAHASGFLDAETFSRAFRRHFGMPPSAVSAGNVDA
ncbi:helix-turn-helix domain-containing protein [Microbacterium sp. NPDC055903]